MKGLEVSSLFKETEKWFWVAVFSMCACIAVSNYLVGFPINDWLTWAALTYPACFLINDLVNRRMGSTKARKVVYIGFALGIVLSYFLATQRIALASGSAFLISQLLDTRLFSYFSNHAKSWWSTPLRSSWCASFVDTWLFFGIAFYASGEPWVSWSIGDLAIKLLVALLLLIPYRLFVSSIKVGTSPLAR